jgi:hypothetical protein
MTIILSVCWSPALVSGRLLLLIRDAPDETLVSVGIFWTGWKLPVRPAIAILPVQSG